MLESKLNLDFKLVEQARAHAARVADDTQRFIDGCTTVAVERTICRLLGIDGVDASDVPLPSVVVDHLMDKGALPQGAAFWIGNAMVETGKGPQAIAEDVAADKLELTELPVHSEADIHAALAPIVEESLAKIRARRKRREDFIAAHGGEKQGPWVYLIVATGNIYEDVVQATAAARQGADVIAVIRTTGQSLLDYVPYGATTEGFGGTYATQENFRLMREAMDKVGEELGRYIRVCNYCSGLCMPEIAAMGAFEGLDVMLNDALYGILFRDINMQRTLVDQSFSRAINAYAGVVINTGEDNYLTTADAVEEAHTVLASQFLNEAFALRAGLPEEQQGLGHAFEIDPDVENGFLYELAQAEMAREIFPKAPLKYMPPHEVHDRQYLPRPGAGRPVQHGDHPDRSEDPPAGHDDRGHPHPLPVRPLPGHSERPVHLPHHARPGQRDCLQGRRHHAEPRRRRSEEGHRSAGPDRAARHLRDPGAGHLCRHQAPPRRRQGPGRRCQQGCWVLQPLP